MTAKIMIDMRRWQRRADDSWQALLAAVRGDGRVVGLLDPLLPPLAAEIVAGLDEVFGNAYVPDVEGGVFVNPAPWGPEQLFVARLLLRPEVYKIAILDEPAVADLPSARIEQVVGRLWLRRYDLLTKNSSLRLPAGPGRRSDERKRARIALITPLPPARSGVADYSAALAKALREFVDVSLFSSDAETPLSTLPHQAARFDRVVSVMGNSPAHHGRIFDLLRRYGGACICHDARLLGFYAGRLGLSGAADIAARELQRDVSADEVDIWARDETKRAAHFLDDLKASATPLVFHARSVADAMGAAYLPFAIYRPWASEDLTPECKQAARRRLGFSESEKIIVSMGFINATKGVAAALQAMAGVDARLVWVGQAAGDISYWQDMADTFGVGGRVTFLNQFCDEATYRDYILAADAGLQLRVGGVGNISGALQDCIAAGLPSVANADLAESLNAPSYVTRVDDGLQPADIATALTDILARFWETEDARADYAARHNMREYAKGLCKLLGILH